MSAPEGTLLRPARSTDAGGCGEILWRASPGSVGRPDLFSCAEAIGLCGLMIERGWVTLVETADSGSATGRRILGFLARDGEDIQALYVAREAGGQGIGAALLAQAKSESPRLYLRANREDKGVCRFYRREGFAERENGGADAAVIAFLWQREDET